MNRLTQILLYPAICLFFVSLAPTARGAPASLADLLAERLSSIVAVEFFEETEIDRRPRTVFGVVAARDGLIALPEASISGGTPAERLKGFTVFQPDDSTPFSADYLGEDPLSGWHFIRVEPPMRERLRPVTEFPLGEPRLGEELWGIGMRPKEEGFTPYLMDGRLSLVQRLPQRTGFSSRDLSGPGLPVFDLDGALVGIGTRPFGRRALMFSRSERGSPVVLLNTNETSVFHFASEALTYFSRVPSNPNGRPIPWVGLYGLEPVSPEVARFLNLENQPGVVISEVLSGGPAESAGLQERDIIIGLEGEAFPRLKPDQAVVGHFENEVLRRAPGTEVAFSILRNGTRMEARVILGEHPKMEKEAERRYFDEFGFGVREFLFGDAVGLRMPPAEGSGVIVSFVKPNSPAGSAGLRSGDWIREIDGEEIGNLEGAVNKLEGVESDPARRELVLLTRRGGESAVLRVKLR